MASSLLATALLSASAQSSTAQSSSRIAATARPTVDADSQPTAKQPAIAPTHDASSLLANALSTVLASTTGHTTRAFSSQIAVTQPHTPTYISEHPLAATPAPTSLCFS